MATPEGEIKDAICKYLRTLAPDLWFYRAQGGAYGHPGVPDIVCCYRGRWVGLEVKTPTGRVSGFQTQCREDVMSAGGVYEVVRSVDDARKVIEGLDRGGFMPSCCFSGGIPAPCILQPSDAWESLF